MQSFYINLFDFTEYPELIIVSGSKLSNCIGMYRKCGEKSSHAEKRPVYKLEGEDRYIYYYPNSMGWRIGNKNSLDGVNAGNYYFGSKKTKHFLIA